GPNVGNITGLRQTEEVLGRRELLRINVSRVKLEMMRQPFRRAHHQAMISGCPGVFICSHRIESRFRSVPEIEEARMCGISLDDREVCITLAKQPVSQNADVTD